jgi:hypothetical protein
LLDSYFEKLIRSNWEKGRTYPCQRHILLLKEPLNISPLELIKFGGAISRRQRSTVNLITERGSITRGECQEQAHSAISIDLLADVGYNVLGCS